MWINVADSLLQRKEKREQVLGRCGAFVLMWKCYLIWVEGLLLAPPPHSGMAEDMWNDCVCMCVSLGLLWLCRILWWYGQLCQNRELFFWRSAANLSGSGVYPTNTSLFSVSAEMIVLFREPTEDSSFTDIIASKFHDCGRNEGLYHVRSCPLCPIIFPSVWCTINNSITFLTNDLPFATFLWRLIRFKHKWILHIHK